jgi:hypothetical protein
MTETTASATGDKGTPAIYDVPSGALSPAGFVSDHAQARSNRISLIFSRNLSILYGAYSE